jgi:hypothetical protein
VLVSPVVWSTPGLAAVQVCGTCSDLCRDSHFAAIIDATSASMLLACLVEQDVLCLSRDLLLVLCFNDVFVTSAAWQVAR